MMARLVATPLPASYGVGATHVPLPEELEVRELVPNTKAEYGDVQFGTKGAPKEWFEWCAV
jgi:hypothetical protein